MTTTEDLKEKCREILKEYFSTRTDNHQKEGLEGLRDLKSLLHEGGKDSDFLSGLFHKWRDVDFAQSPQTLWAVFAPLLRSGGRDYQILSPDKKTREREVPSHVLFLHNIRSAHNLGALTRTAEFFGLSEVILSGYSSNQMKSSFKKSSMGAEDFLTLSYTCDPWKFLSRKKEEGFIITGIETAMTSQPLVQSKTMVGERRMILLGNEEHGLEAYLLDFCDEIYFIPGLGAKGSLNITAAAACALYHFTHQAHGRQYDL